MKKELSALFFVSFQQARGIIEVSAVKDGKSLREVEYLW